MKRLLQQARWLALIAGMVILFSPELFSDDLSTNGSDPLATSDSNSVTNGLNKIAIGEYMDFFIVDGKLKALGSNRGNEAGFPKEHGNINIPAQTIPTLADRTFIDVSCGGYQAIGLDSTGHVWVWGCNNFGEFGIGAPDKELHLPKQIETDINGDPFEDVVSVIGGFEFFLALKKDGSVWVWGSSGFDGVIYDSTGMCGNGDKTKHNVTRPAKVIFPDGVTITQIDASWTMAAALDSTGGVWTWGGGDAVENRGTGNHDPSTPTKLPKLPSGIKSIAIGVNWNYALDSDGNLWGWGMEGAYLGIKEAQNAYMPIATPRKLNFPDLNGHVKAVVVSQQSSHALKDDGTLWGWGASPMGEVGDGTAHDWTKTNPPTYAWDWHNGEDMIMKPVQVLDDVKTVYGSSQAAYVFAVKNDGTIWSWGRNKTGVLGNGVMPPSNDAAIHPNKWDVAKPTQVKPF